MATAVREIVNAWIEKYPEQNRDQLARRLRASKQFESAFFELFMHELVHKLGYVVEAHPPVQSGSAKRPDFCLKGPANEVCYLEATLATDEPESSRSADSLRRSLLEQLGDLGSPDFVMHVEIKGNLERLPRISRLKRQLQDWLNLLDWHQCRQLVDQGRMEELPKYDASCDGLPHTFIAIPKPPGRRGQADARAIGSEIFELKMNPVKAIRRAVKQKAGRYGRLGHQYVVAVSALRAWPDPFVIDEALRGSGAERLRLTDDGQERLERVPAGDGIWLGPHGPRNRRVSAVLLVFGLEPTTVASDHMRLILYHNPWAQEPYSGSLCRLPQRRLEGGQWVEVQGVAARDILGLKETWLRDLW